MPSHAQPRAVAAFRVPAITQCSFEWVRLYGVSKDTRAKAVNPRKYVRKTWRCNRCGVGTARNRPACVFHEAHGGDSIIESKVSATRVIQCDEIRTQEDQSRRSIEFMARSDREFRDGISARRHATVLSMQRAGISTPLIDAIVLLAEDDMPLAPVVARTIWSLEVLLP